MRKGKRKPLEKALLPLDDPVTDYMKMTITRLEIDVDSRLKAEKSQGLRNR